jgi:NAD(P)-dependent dehydrogenase (short-subunit alcohol dehydrogenase family)
MILLFASQTQVDNDLAIVIKVLGLRFIPNPTKYMNRVQASRSSKQALNNWSREAALELKADGISLNVVNPGWVKT